MHIGSENASEHSEGGGEDRGERGRGGKEGEREGGRRQRREEGEENDMTWQHYIHTIASTVYTNSSHVSTDSLVLYPTW